MRSEGARLLLSNFFLSSFPYSLYLCWVGFLASSSSLESRSRSPLTNSASLFSLSLMRMSSSSLSLSPPCSTLLDLTGSAGPYCGVGRWVLARSLPCWHSLNGSVRTGDLGAPAREEDGAEKRSTSETGAAADAEEDVDAVAVLLPPPDSFLAFFFA